MAYNNIHSYKIENLPVKYSHILPFIWESLQGETADHSSGCSFQQGMRVKLIDPHGTKAMILDSVNWVNSISELKSVKHMHISQPD